MTEKKQQSTPQPDHLQSPYYPPEDEISLIDMFEVLFRKKILILAVTSIFTLLAIFYAQSITPVYRVTIGFLPSDETSLASYFPDYMAGFLPSFTQYDLNGKVVKKNKTLFQKFLPAIQSYRLQEKVFIENNFIKRFTNDNLDSSAIKKIVLEMNNSIRVKGAKASSDETVYLEDETVYLEMVGTNPEIMSDFLNVLAEAVKNEVANNTKESIQRVVKNYIDNYSAKLENLHLTARSERSNKISQLSENLEIAKKLGIVKNNFDNPAPSSFAFMVGRFVSPTTEDRALKFMKDRAPPLWYLYGQHALEQELEILKRQPFQDQHIEDSAELNLEITNLSRVDLSKINLVPIIINQPSIPPTQPFEPDKIKIIAAGIALGLLFGVIAAFLSNLVGQLRARKSAT